MLFSMKIMQTRTEQYILTTQNRAATDLNIKKKDF